MPILIMHKKNQKILDKHPDLTWNEIKFIANQILKSKRNRIRQGYIIDFRIPGLGTFRTHGNRKVKRMTEVMKRDRKRKRLKYRELGLTRKKLLY